MQVGFGLVVARWKRSFFEPVFDRRDAAFHSALGAHANIRGLVENEPHVCSRIALAHHLHREIDDWVNSAQYEVYRTFISVLALIGFFTLGAMRSDVSLLAGLPYYFGISSIASIAFSSAKGLALRQSAYNCARDCNFLSD
jgi:hypothetical protein